LKSRKGICLNRNQCPLSDQRGEITVDANEPFACPVCGSGLQEIAAETVDEKSKPRSGGVLVISLVVVVLLLAGGGYFFRDKLLGLFRGQAATHGTVLLRFAGSNTIGDKLVPALAEAYLQSQGASNIHTVVGAQPEDKTVIGVLPGSSDPVEIDVAAHGSATAFTSLADSSCDIGMASRSVKSDEAAKLAALGTMTDASNEHVLGLDGIAIIVNPHNALNEITVEKLQGIFTGEYDKWQGGAPINIYARDDKSGTYDTFKNLVLAGKPLSKSAKRFEDSNALSDAVANDPNGIGFIGLPFIRNAKALAIADKGTKPLLPTTLTVATEDYSLSRRLYLYTPANAANAHVREFVQFALSPAGQQVVAANGFIAQTAEQATVQVAADAPPEYRDLTANAKRLPIDFRFLKGKTQLDNRAVADLDRVVAQTAQSGNAKAKIMLFGFSDSAGNSATNQKLSHDRAQVVAGELSRRGINASVVEGFGAALPVASNDSPEGREKNRRVEIWIAGQ